MSPSRSRSPKPSYRRSRTRSLSLSRSSGSLRENRRSHSPVEVRRSAESKWGRSSRSLVNSREPSDDEYEDSVRSRRRQGHGSYEHGPRDARTRKGKERATTLTPARGDSAPPLIDRPLQTSGSVAQFGANEISIPALGSLSKDIKGKQKAEVRPSDTPFVGTSVTVTPTAATPLRDDVVPLETYSNTHAAAGDGENVFGASVASASRKQASGNLRPPRNRTLLESVQAHLACSSAPRRIDPIKRPEAAGEAVDTRGAVSAHVPSSDPPALRSQLSTPTAIHGRPPHSSPVHDFPNATAVQKSEIPTNRRPISFNQEGIAADTRKYSAPEIMARVRHKLAKLKDEHQPGAALPSPSPTVDRNDVPPTTIVSAPNHNPPSHNFNAGTKDGFGRRGNLESATDNKTYPCDMSSSDTRSVLLQKLQVEQKLAQNVIPHPHSSKPSPSHHAVSQVLHSDSGKQSGSSPRRNEADTSVLETKLRTRLTAIKRAANENPLDHNISSSGKDGGISFNGDAESSNREENLRARLRKRLV
ncbi:hypothetical protein BV22DRAFT_394973 [Leucogyrophana mollusca]|uniref:Uncharacterized protein n=1 Tax=Leucogyrophana mollusca TaxID=85980 RepID=A0ACB8BMB9_9AGAM|nr:hypothetical protein BV22DRAFT_394973 [Leucogyrophana mollusca]